MRATAPITVPPRRYDRVIATTVLLGQFEDLVAYGLRAILSEDELLEIVAHDVAMSSLPAAIAEHEPDLAIINFTALRTPVQIHELHVSHPDARLVILAQRPSAAECQQLLSFGATALLEKDTERRDLLNTLHLASRGMHVLPRALRGDPVAEMGPELLTAREAEVLELLQAGHSNAELAVRLGVGVETIRTHVRNIYRKLGVSSRRELATR